MRNVYPRETVAHLWAHSAQDSARDRESNFYFRGPTLYSYGSHFAIAHILKGPEYGELSGRILWNDASYSMTTSRHQTIAWRALTQQQNESRLRVPTLNADDARAIDRAIREKRIPNYCDGLLWRIQGHIASLVGKRHGSEPFCSALFNARKYDATARAIYAHARKRYPLDPIPAGADIPADKVSRGVFVTTFSRAIVAADYKTAISNAAAYLRTAQDSETSPTGIEYTDPLSDDCRITASCDVATKGLRACADADKHYATLHAGKRSAQVSRIRRALTPLAESFKNAREAAEKAVTLRQLEHFARAFYKEQYARKHTRTYRHRFDLRNLPGYIKRECERADSLGIAPDSLIGHAIARARAIDNARAIVRAVENARVSFDAAEAYGTRLPGDAIRCYTEVMNYARQIKARGGRASEFYCKQVSGLSDSAEARIVELRAELTRVNAQKIADWISGASNVAPPYDAGTFARIRGDFVETTRGASAPIEHVRRLADIYSRIVAAGGKQWPDGVGPIVGHFRVNSIGTDGSLIIGCHRFDAAEAKRLHALVTA